MMVQDTQTNLTSADRVYRTMREQITLAELKPGARLVHRHLAQQFGTSNIPVLEALRRLESDGLIVSYPNAGAQVKIWNEHDVRGAFLAREALEGVTCRMFAEQASALEKKKLEEYSRRFDEACATRDYLAGRKLDIQLHLHIARSANSRHSAGAGSSSLFRLFENSYLLSATITNSLPNPENVADYSGPVGVHQDLVAALLSGDFDMAEAAGEMHVRNSMDDILALMAKREDI